MKFNFTCIRDVTFRVPRIACDSEFSIELMGIYTVFDRVPLPRIVDSPKDLHTNLKFQNQAILICCLFEPHEVKHDKGVGRERVASVYMTTHCQ